VPVSEAHEIACGLCHRDASFGKPLIDHEGVGFSLAGQHDGPQISRVDGYIGAPMCLTAVQTALRKPRASRCVGSLMRVAESAGVQCMGGQGVPGGHDRGAGVPRVPRLSGSMTPNRGAISGSSRRRCKRDMRTRRVSREIFATSFSANRFFLPRVFGKVTCQCPSPRKTRIAFVTGAAFRYRRALRLNLQVQGGDGQFGFGYRYPGAPIYCRANQGCGGARLVIKEKEVYGYSDGRCGQRTLWNRFR